MSVAVQRVLEQLLQRSEDDRDRCAQAPASAEVEELQRHVFSSPAREQTLGSWPDWVDPVVVDAWRAAGVDQPWEHQVLAADAVFSGSSTVLATATGSGKSLAYWTPALTSARIPRGSGFGTTLYLAPTKALAGDQAAGLRSLLRTGGVDDVHAATVDGDASWDERRWAQESAQIVLSNPDMLHFSILPGHARWRRFFRSLQYVVIDEAHAYRGVFGAHVAAVLRRLKRLARHYGADPVFVLASATTSDPDVSAARLIGEPAESITIVDDDTSPRGEQTVMLWEPAYFPGVDEYAPWIARSATNEAGHLLADLVSVGARTLVFSRSRAGAEVIAEVARGIVSDRTGSYELAQKIATYRGGYLPEERRELEEQLRSGDVLGMASTNALELGVDISGLDAVIIAGWPGTRVSVRQQSGRSGRAGAPGVAVFISRDDPLDTFLVHHPEELMEAPVEATTFDPVNPYVLAPHLCAAASELPLTEADMATFGVEPSDADTVRSVVDLLVKQEALRKRPSGWFWTRRERAADLADLRGSGGTVTIVDHAGGDVIGTIDAASADAQVHTGAVYTHQGVDFLVDEYCPEDDVALVRRTHVPYWTLSLSETDIHVIREQNSLTWGPVTWHTGLVDVTSRVTGFQQRRQGDGELLNTVSLELPDHTLTTMACWWTVPAEVLAAAEVPADDVPGALHAAEHASIGVLPLLVSCDRWDVGGVAAPQHRDTELPTVFVHDGLPGGSGFAVRGFWRAAEWLQATREVIAQCGCVSGCPSCVQSPKCGSNNSPLNKAAALRLLTTMLEHVRQDQPAPSHSS